MKLTPAAVKALTPPSNVLERTIWDDDTPGFGVRLRAGGSARWIVQYDLGGKTRRITLGPVTLMSLGSARRHARDMLAGMRLGSDPAADRRAGRAAARETFGGFLTRYLTTKQAEVRADTLKQLDHRLRALARPLHPQPVTTIGRRTIAGLLSAVGERSGPSAAVNLHGSLSGYFAWLVSEGLLEVNPMIGVTRPAASAARERVLTEDEVRILWGALGDDDYGDIVRLLILTGSRRRDRRPAVGRGRSRPRPDRNPGRAHEGRQGAPHPAQRAGVGHPPAAATRWARSRLRFQRYRLRQLVAGAARPG